MRRSVDIREILAGWPLESGEEYRLTRGDDGRKILQVRLLLGLQQCELEGRPDGQRPHGKETLLDYLRGRRGEGRHKTSGRPARLGFSACSRLIEEGALYCLRCHWLQHVGDWMRVARDAQHILELMDLLKHHARAEEDQVCLEQWRPYYLRMRAEALARYELEQQRPARALALVKAALQDLEALPELPTPLFCRYRRQGMARLRKLAARIEKKRPPTELDNLERQLRRAVKAEAFERAARLRDRIRTLRRMSCPRGKSPPSRSAGTA